MAREPADNNGCGSLGGGKLQAPNIDGDDPKRIPWLKIAYLFWNDYDNTSEARMA